MKKSKSDKKYSEITGIILLVIAFLLLIGFYFNVDAVLLVILKNLISDGIGVGGYIVPLIIGFIGFAMIAQKRFRNLNKKFYGFLSFSITVYFIISLVTLNNYNESSYIDMIRNIIVTNSSFHGGILGITIMNFFNSIIGFWGTLIALIAVNIISLILLFDISLYDIANITKKKVNSVCKARILVNENENKDEKNVVAKKDTVVNQKSKANISIVKFLSKSLAVDNSQNSDLDSQPCIEPETIKLETQEVLNEINIVSEEKNNTYDQILESKSNYQTEKENITYESPDINFLEDAIAIDHKMINNEIQSKKEVLQRTLDNFGVKATIKHAEKGPAVTRYEVEPHKGVKVSKIVNLADDIALALASSGIRIEAPIPGKSFVGIEVPNDTISAVKLKEIIESNEFNSPKLKLGVGLGKDISGKSIVADLATMPHLLIAGATGSGKSVCINTILVSILYKYDPDQVKIILIDPKVVELNIYNGIPHLLIPVVTDPKKASNALNWAITEMTKRYNKFAEKGVRNIDGYNDLYSKKQIDEKIPYIVIIIDELADLMMACHSEVEDSIARLAQMARAAGMHLIIATQRPSVDVITGVIKANIPSRISFSVSSQIDSRTILDQSGAEKLLGRGDMLFYPMGYLKPQRVQGAYISEMEVEQIVNHVKKQHKSKTDYKEEIIEHINKVSMKMDSNNEDDELVSEAINIVLEYNNASTSLVQRKLRIGYNRAASIMEELESRGIIGFKGSSNKREVLVDKKDYIDD